LKGFTKIGLWTWSFLSRHIKTHLLVPTNGGERKQMHGEASYFSKFQKFHKETLKT